MNVYVCYTALQPATVTLFVSQLVAERLDIVSTGTDVSNALKKLPSLAGFSVSVSGSSITGGMRYTVTFSGDGGRPYCDHTGNFPVQVACMHLTRYYASACHCLLHM